MLPPETHTTTASLHFPTAMPSRFSHIPFLGPIVRDFSLLTRAVTQRLSPPPTPEEFPRSASEAQVRAWLATSTLDGYPEDDDGERPEPRRRHTTRESRSERTWTDAEPRRARGESERRRRRDRDGRRRSTAEDARSYSRRGSGTS